MPRLRCPRCTSGTLEVVEDDDDRLYTCLSCARYWWACPERGCNGVLRLDGRCSACNHGDDVALYGAIRITPQYFGLASVETPPLPECDSEGRPLRTRWSGGYR
jgi:hypothetical protein